MSASLARPLGTIRVGENGEITVPASYQKKHKLAKGSALVLMQVGESLVMVPADEAFTRLCQRLQDILAGEGISLKHALKNLETVRQQQFQDLYGKE